MRRVEDELGKKNLASAFVYLSLLDIYSVKRKLLTKKRHILSFDDRSAVGGVGGGAHHVSRELDA